MRFYDFLLEVTQNEALFQRLANFAKALNANVSDATLKRIAGELSSSGMQANHVDDKQISNILTSLFATLSQKPTTANTPDTSELMNFVKNKVKEFVSHLRNKLPVQSQPIPSKEISKSIPVPKPSAAKTPKLKKTNASKPKAPNKTASKNEIPKNLRNHPDITEFGNTPDEPPELSNPPTDAEIDALVAWYFDPKNKQVKPMLDGKTPGVALRSKGGEKSKPEDRLDRETITKLLKQQKLPKPSFAEFNPEDPESVEEFLSHYDDDEKINFMGTKFTKDELRNYLLRLKKKPKY